MNDRAHWPSENIARAKYYFSQVLKQRDPNNQQAAKVEREARSIVDQSLQHEGLGKAAAYRGSYPLLFDFMVPWECRLVTPRKGQCLAAVTPATEGMIYDIINRPPCRIDLRIRG